MTTLLRQLCLGLCAALLPASMLAAATTVDVDAREAPRGILHTHLVMAVKPGALTLLYPKWLPGEHSPTGPVAGLSALTFTANGRPLEWHRDLDNMFAFHLRIPSDVRSLEVNFEVLSVKEASGQNALRTSTDSLAVILWNQLVLYPAGAQSDDLQYTASLAVPSGWQMAGALVPAGAADRAQLRPVSLTTLIDSPVITGRYLKTLELGGSPRPMRISSPTAVRRSRCPKPLRRNLPAS